MILMTSWACRWTSPPACAAPTSAAPASRPSWRASLRVAGPPWTNTSRAPVRGSSNLGSQARCCPRSSSSSSSGCIQQAICLPSQVNLACPWLRLNSSCPPPPLAWLPPGNSSSTNSPSPPPSPKPPPPQQLQLSLSSCLPCLPWLRHPPPLPRTGPRRLRPPTQLCPPSPLRTHPHPPTLACPPFRPCKPSRPSTPLPSRSRPLPPFPRCRPCLKEDLSWAPSQPCTRVGRSMVLARCSLLRHSSWMHPTRTDHGPREVCIITALKLDAQKLDAARSWLGVRPCRARAGQHRPCTRGVHRCRAWPLRTPFLRLPPFSMCCCRCVDALWLCRPLRCVCATSARLHKCMAMHRTCVLQLQLGLLTRAEPSAS
mmetsp:Transcript_10779/g.29565  ORF Transcript_10779/g.29565 Transcript_10779/m.29565 type:complete len:371 (+) Transcript_10779:858-1970(+)